MELDEKFFHVYNRIDESCMAIGYKGKEKNAS